MKTKLFKRIGSLLLVCVMCFGLCSTTFAAESDGAFEIETVEENNASQRNGHGEVSVGGTLNISLGTLSNTVAGKKITFITASKAADGNKLNWVLYRNGREHTSGTVLVNEMKTITLDLSSGSYTVGFTNTAPKPVTVYAYFE